MIILTGANCDIPKDDSGNIDKTLKFTFSAVIKETVKKANECGYRPIVYDLGSLGIGCPFHVEDESFASKGYYEKEAKEGYKSKSLFKPEMVKKCIEEHNELTVYLDGDAKLCENIDEIQDGNFDIGVTLRDPSEIESEWHQEHFDIVKYVNAGVIFFKPTKATKTFIDIWEKTTDELGNDQMALNKLTCPDFYPEINSILTLNGVRVKYFPCKKYNFYYFDEGLPSDIKIMHFKGPVRRFYPFNWRVRFYCLNIVPIKNKLRHLLKFFLK